jgi:formylglycine-generating enzyme required for sulfatase activity
MVGNLFEWVADWVPRSTACGTWSAGVSPTGDYQCLAGAATTGEPGALLRGGDFGEFGLGANAGPLTVSGDSGPSNEYNGHRRGFRCAR